MSRFRSLLLLGLVLLVTTAGQAQVLARPGWAGSGVAPEAWWLRAVIYRLDPARFQDSNGDGRGDLAGVAERLEYLQSLGIDALLLDGTFDNEALGDLVRDASRHHLRVLVTVPPATAAGPTNVLLRSAREWLSAGVAGLWLPPDGEGEVAYASAATALRGLLQSFPGERVLLTESAYASFSASAEAARPTRHSIDPNTFGAARGGVLVAAAPLPVGAADAPQLRESLTASGREPGPGLHPLLRFAHPPATGSKQAAADAALLLGGRGAILLDFGEELGLDCYPNAAVRTSSLPVMQWTPSNRTPVPAAKPESTAGAAPTPEFGAYHPYIRPPRGIAPPSTAAIRVVPDLNQEPAPPAPDSLPGFSTGAPPSPSLDAADLNVTTEDRNPASLLNLYRQLIALHHGNPTLRNGSLDVLTPATAGAVVWVRRAPAGSRTAANVIGAANLTGQPLTLALNGDLQTLGVRPGALRVLFASSPSERAGEASESLTLAPRAALLAEIYHFGAEPATTSSRHRIRR